MRTPLLIVFAVATLWSFAAAATADVSAGANPVSADHSENRPDPANVRTDHADVLTFIETRADAADHGNAVLRRYASALRRDGRSQPSVELLQEVARPERFVLIESSETVEPGSDTRRSPNLEELSDVLTAPPDRRSHREFGDSAAANVAAPGKRATLYVITHVDIGPPDRPRGEAALRRWAVEARQSPGIRSFRIWQQTDRVNHFNIIAVWNARESFDAFAASPAAREFRQAVGSLLGSLYDERLYKLVE